ncbi:MAG TPA: hypothetical protein VFQ40_00610 [Actinomycetota bacterium]|nr:hypothetical protein [Actinomycetota bacterium]
MMADPEGADAAVHLLRRELYWAQAGVRRARADTVSLRDQLHGYALRRRTEEAQFHPVGERALRSTSASRRVVKSGIWRVLRFATQRYDRLLAELAELNAGLAERVIAAEDEVAHLRSEVERLRRDGS